MPHISRLLDTVSEGQRNGRKLGEKMESTEDRFFNGRNFKMFVSLGANKKIERWCKGGRGDFSSASLGTGTGTGPRHAQENPPTPRAQTGPLQQQEGQQRMELQALAAGRCAGMWSSSL